MSGAAVDLVRYFERVGYGGTATPTLDTLQALHALHTAAIPFENLSPLLGEPVSLDLEALQKKLFAPGRGGWCFEHNTLFAHVLEAIGFRVRRLAARVRWNVPPEVTTARSHMLMRVEVEDEPYVADVGFGGVTLTGPLRLVPGLEQATPHEPHRLVEEGEGYALEALIGGEWQRLYVFEMQQQQPVDYEVSNFFLSHHPRSPFLSGLLAARAAPECRHALRNTRYARHGRDGKTERRYVASVQELRELLAGPFRIALPASPQLEAKLQDVIDRHPPDETA